MASDEIDRSVATRATSTQAPVTFEIPRPVIAEAIVNAVAHRNYRHNGYDCRLQESGTKRLLPTCT